MRPRHPGDLRLDLGQLSQQRIVRGGRHLGRQRRHVIGTAHHRDLFVPASRRTQRLAHVGLTQLVLLIGGLALADGRHRLADHLEDVLVTLLDEVLPPAFRVVVASRIGEQPQRIRLHRPLLVFPGEAERTGQVDERGGAAVPDRPAERLPFR